MRPELFQAAVLSVPFVDMVTAMTDQALPLTVHEYDEWGDPNVDEVFSYMLDYDPYHNLKPQVRVPFPLLLI
jgi:oligopeptidase B